VVTSADSQHSQIDRIYAIWQAAHPNEWDYDTAGKQPLYPFRYPRPTNDYRYWTVDDCQNTSELGYTYVDADFKTAQAVKDNDQDKYDWAVRYTGDLAQGHKIQRLGTCPPSMLPPTAEQYAKAQVFASAGPMARASNVVQRMAVDSINAAQIIVGSAHESKPQAGTNSATVQHLAPSAKLTENRVLSGELYDTVGAHKDGDVNEARVQRRWYIDNMVER
jgi:hypothetical protein